MASSGLHVCYSNSLPILVGHLADGLRADPLPPLERELILVQSQGMRRWVTLQLALRHGCAASLDLPFPAAFCHRLVARIAGDSGPGKDERLFSREAMTWRILAMLDQAAGDRGYADLVAYLRDGDPHKRYQLAARIADTLDDYQLYRPDLLLAWEAEDREAERMPHEAWQADLWRRLCGGRRPDHLARRLRRLADDLREGRVPAERLPRRVSVFGVSTLAPAVMDLLAALGRNIPVRVYAVCATRRVISEAESGPGNTLAESMGLQGREFFALLRNAQPDEAFWHDVGFADPGDDTLLHALQSDILRDAEPGPEPRAVTPGDTSLLVHVCHSSLREMEVLRDQILAAFEADETLRPEDVLVLMPDVAARAPYIEAVFGVEHPGVPRLPFRVADRRLTAERPLADAFLGVLRLADSRLTTTEVLALLDHEAARRAAGLARGDMPAVRNWVRQTNIRWGEDGPHRRDVCGLPGIEANTWRAGLDRLLLGHAMGDTEQVVAGILPFGGVAPDQAEVIGRFASWLDRLFDALRRLREPRPLRGWAEALAAALRDLFEPGDEDDEAGLQLVRSALAGLAEAQEYAGLGSDLPLAVVRDHLEAVFRDDGFGSGFISGAVTFCALKPMRTIPFRVIAIAGLDSDSFPRQDRPPTFDLQAADRRPGDRSLRVDDRQLFLECLLAAGDRLWISYVGRSAKDNSELAPSVCLSELLDCLDQGFRSPDAAAARQTVTVEHRLQPFSPAYYDGSDPRLFSYAAHNCPPPPDAARHGPTRFAPQLLPETEGVLVLTLSDLVNFWVHPCRHFCQRVLGLTLREAEEETEDVEPLDVNNLQKYLVNDWLVARRLRGLGASDEEVEIVSAQGQLPPADLGRAWYRKVIADLTPFVEGVGGLRFRDPVAFDLSGDDWRLSAEVSGLTDDARVQFRPADMKFKDQVRAWVTHVVLNAAAAANGLPRLTRLLAKDKEGHFRPLDDPRRVLDGLIADYREGQRAPAALFERSSPAFVRALSRHEGDEDGASTAHKAAAAGWYPNRFRPGEGDADDPYVALCFRGVMPLNDMREAFERWARRLWTPLLGHWGDGEP